MQTMVQYPRVEELNQNSAQRISNITNFDFSEHPNEGVHTNRRVTFLTVANNLIRRLWNALLR